MQNNSFFLCPVNFIILWCVLRRRSTLVHFVLFDLEKRMISRFLWKPSLLCLITAKNLCYSSKRSSFTVRSKSPSKGIRRINIRFGTLFSIRSMSGPASASSPAMEKMVSENEAEQIGRLLTGKNDDHGGVIVEMNTEPMDAAVFVSLLRASISHWNQQGKKGLWIKLPIELVNLVEPAVKEGFYFHHAEPKYLMLVYWIPKTANTIPANATHRVGIGAFVMNEKREVLVVQEKSGRFRGTGLWKFPTGVVDEGEDICDATVREVKEETGIDTRFEEILAFRQSHKTFFDKSDLFFVCLMQPVSFDIQKQESEIEAAQWMPFEEYAAQHFVQKNELLKYIVDVCLAKRDGKYSGFSPVPTTTSFSDIPSYLYLNGHSLNSQ